MASEQYRAWIARDVKPEEKWELTPQERRKNWWHYNKWLVIGGIVLGSILLRLIANALGIGIAKPDYQIAYVGQYPLPEDSAQAVCTAFQTLGTDLNGDGQVLVILNQYAAGSAETAYGAEVRLIADITDCESYFFLLEDPDDFQRKQQVLALPDGSCPGNYDLAGMDKVHRWEDIPALTSQDLGTYQEIIMGETLEGSNQELLKDLYLGRRCFYSENKNTPAAVGSWGALWDTLVEGVT